MSRRRPARSSRAQRVREARKAVRTRLGVAVGVLAIVAGAIGAVLTIGSVGAVMEEFGVLAFRSRMTGSLPPFLLTYIVAGVCAVGGIGLLAPAKWGWWVAGGGAVLGLCDLGRLYFRLFAAIDPEHPRAAEATAEILVIVAIPAIFFIGILGLLVQRRVRIAYRVSRDDEAALELGDEGEEPA